MKIESVPDPLDLIQGNFPDDDEVKFAASASALALKATRHEELAGEYRSAIASLPEEKFAGMTADKSRAELGKLAQRHDDESQYNQKLSESFGSLAEQIISTKNMINTECTGATAKITELEATKMAATSEADRNEAQNQIDRTTQHARDDIKSLNDMLENSMTEAETELGVLSAQMEAASTEVAPGSSGGEETAATRVARSTPMPAALRASHGDPLPSGPATSADLPRAGAQPLAGTPDAAMSPASMMSALPQPQMPQAGAPSGGMPGGGMGSQLPGQELASKAMDMAQNVGGPNTYLSDDAVKDLLAASAADGGPSGSGAGLSGAGESHGDAAAGGGVGGVGGVGPSNPTTAASPSPATPVSTPRPAGGPSLAVTELASGAPSGTAALGGLAASGSGLGGVAAGAASNVVAATAPGVNAVTSQAGLAPTGLTPMPTAGSVALPSTPVAPAPAVSAPPVSAAPPATPEAPPTPPAAGSPGGSVSPPATAGAAPKALAPDVGTAPAGVAGGSPPLVAMPPVTPGVSALPPSLRGALVLDWVAPSMISVRAAAPERLEDLPAPQRITILNTAAIVSQMRAMGMPPSVATGLIYDGTTVAVAIATADDISILPPDIVIPESSLLLNRFHLGEDFRTQWAGCADTATKLLAAVDVHPQLDRSMVLHVSAYTTLPEIADPAVPFTPISMDAAWAIRFLYTPPPMTVPAYTLREETFTPTQIEYLLRTAERTWQLPTRRLAREGQARLESASMYASRWSRTEEVGLSEPPRGYDARIAGHLWAATREALLAGDLERASWYGQYLRYQTLPAAKPEAA